MWGSFRALIHFFNIAFIANCGGGRENQVRTSLAFRAHVFMFLLFSTSVKVLMRARGNGYTL